MPRRTITPLPILNRAKLIALGSVEEHSSAVQSSTQWRSSSSGVTYAQQNNVDEAVEATSGSQDLNLYAHAQGTTWVPIRAAGQNDEAISY